MTTLIYHQSQLFALQEGLAGVDLEAFNPVKGENYRVLVLDYEYFQMSAPDHQPFKKNMVLTEEFVRRFGEDYVVDDLSLAPNIYGVYGIRKEYVETIIRWFTASGATVSVMPYGFYWQAYRSRQLSDQGDFLFCFVHRLEKLVLMMVLTKESMSRVRVVDAAEESVICDEVIRFYKNVSYKTPGPAQEISQRALFLVSDSELVTYAQTQEMISHQSGRALELGEMTEFLVGGGGELTFELPELVIEAQRRRRETQQQRVIRLVTILAVVLGALCGFLALCTGQLAREFKNQQDEVLRLERDISELSVKVYQDYYKSGSQNFGEVYLGFITSLPAGYFVDTFEIKRRSSQFLQCDFYVYLNAKAQILAGLDPVESAQDFNEYLRVLKTLPGKHISYWMKDL